MKGETVVPNLKGDTHMQLASIRAVTTVALATLALAACGNAEDRAKAAADRPNTESNVPVVAPDDAAEAAARASTPQASLTPEQREELRTLAKGYIDDAAKQVAQGHTPATGFEDAVVALQPGQTHNWTLALKRGVDYRIIGACDNECENLDMELVDARGRVVEADTLEDSFPVINITPGADITYTARIKMITCTIAPCYTAARVYTKN